MENEALCRLFEANDCELLKGYSEHQYSINDLQEITQHTYREIHDTLYNEFPEYVEQRRDNQTYMYQLIEHFINLGIPIDIFREDVPLIQHIHQVKTLQRTIQRMLQSGKISPDIKPMTSTKFLSMVRRIEIKDFLVSNMKSQSPLLIKDIAQTFGVSQSFVFKINRKLDEVAPENTQLDNSREYDRVERLYDIYEQVEEGLSKSDITERYDITKEDLLITVKTFKLMQEH